MLSGVSPPGAGDGVVVDFGFSEPGVAEVGFGVVELVGVVDVDFGVAVSEDPDGAAPPAPRTEPLESTGAGLTSR